MKWGTCSKELKKYREQIDSPFTDTKYPMKKGHLLPCHMQHATTKKQIYQDKRTLGGYKLIYDVSVTTPTSDFTT